MVGSHIAAFSYVGFANLMLRRYPEALRSLNTVLIYLARSKTYHQRLPQVFSFVFDALISGFGTALASLWPPFGLLFCGWGGGRRRGTARGRKGRSRRFTVDPPAAPSVSAV